ncbi:glycosyltransferase [Candidatus Pelagibacter communis]|uniref:glycosyltransferase n=1 Tax=Pelagibacter ubique TaxID=198252 RepID=UPI00094D9E00|nr:glycosyltransferase [Candidatus Pelagibacter ubique]|tara:strand:- start:3000 stop:4109 length:1110 start_codon:yes stop_codon:yes gene_type:complete
MNNELILFYPSFERGGVEKILQNLIENNNSFKINLISTKNALKVIDQKKFKFNFFEVKKKFIIPFFPERFSTAINAMIILFNIVNQKKKKFVIHSMQSNVAAIIIGIIKNQKVIIRNSENAIFSILHAENRLFAFITTLLKICFYNFADGIVTNSVGSGKSLKYFVINRKKIKPIYNPYLKSKNNKKHLKKNIIINIGRLRKQKDHSTLIKAFQIFSKTNKKYKLLILGKGNLENKLKQLSIDLKINDKVIFKGWKQNTSFYLKNSKLFVFSSKYEGLGNVLIDAINYNIPCISTNCPSGPSEILLNGKGGYLVKSGSPQILAQKMSFAIQNYSLSLKKNAYAKRKLNRFLISNQVKKYYDYLNSFYKN